MPVTTILIEIQTGGSAVVQLDPHGKSSGFTPQDLPEYAECVCIHDVGQLRWHKS